MGAPLGIYAGIDPNFGQPFNLYPWVGGKFEPFSPQELEARYPSRDAYVRLVRKAAAALLADRFILEEDYDAYVAAAKHEW